RTFWGGADMRRWLATGATIVGVAVLASPLNTASTCRDGWHSPSIGRPGACSWHGGVQSGQPFGLYLGLAAGGAVWYFTRERQLPKGGFNLHYRNLGPNRVCPY